MCDCIIEFEKRFMDEIKEFEGKKVEYIRYQGSGLNFETGKASYVLKFNVSVEGQKKYKTANVAMSHCPLCGEKLN